MTTQRCTVTERAEHYGGVVWLVLDPHGNPVWPTISPTRREAWDAAAVGAGAPPSALRAAGAQAVRLDYRYTRRVSA